MGVAGLFAFLRRKYPLIVEPCQQQPEEAGEGGEGGEEQEAAGAAASMCDNLYIDLNHIIHACTHPSWRDKPHESELEMFREMELYFQRLVGITRPQQLLFVAMDGVAPQAKMNQQRGRRFYAAHVEGMRGEIEAQVRREMAAGTGDSPSAILPLPDFNGNMITPGTAFMDRLSAHLRAFLARKVAEDPAWRHMLVLFSDSSEPGEGEHKIMRFIRHQRMQGDYSPNTRHIIYGQDADLILLGLLSHEPHFAILRESEAMALESPGTLDAEDLAAAAGAAGTAGDDADSPEAEAAGAEGAEEVAEAFWSRVGEQPLHLLRLSTLREYLKFEFAEFIRPKQAGEGGGDEEGEIDLITGERRKPNPHHGKAGRAGGAAGNGGVSPGGGSGGGGGGAYNFERIIDDVVLLTFLAGNDFLPNVPSLDIYDRPSALQVLLDRYKELLAGAGSSKRGYLVHNGRIDADKLRWVLERLAGAEERTFQEREVRRQREAARKVREEQERQGGPCAAQQGHDKRDGGWLGGGEWVSMGELAPGADLDAALNALPTAGQDSQEALGASGLDLATAQPGQLRRELMARVRDRLHGRQMAGASADPVRLSLPGYRERWYDRHFVKEGQELERVVRRACTEYIRGLAWTFRYYCCGSYPAPPPGRPAPAPAAYGDTPYAAWDWHYPFHYAPLASDLVKFVREGVREPRSPQASAPVPPFVQLMSVLPLSSFADCLPPLLARAALDPATGLLAPATPSGGGHYLGEQEKEGEGEEGVHEGAFPSDVGPLVDLSGKKWAHTAVVRLPFPNVRAISAFVLRLLGSEDCHLSAAERARNLSRPAVLLCHAEHPLALCMRPGAGRASEPGAAAAAAGAAGAAEDGASATGSREQEAAESHEAPAQGGSGLPAEGPAPAPAPAGSAAPAADAPASARDVSKAAEPAGPGDAGSQLPSPAPASSSSSSSSSSKETAAAPPHPAASLLPLVLPLPASLKDAPEGGGEPGAQEEASGLLEPQPAGVEGVVAVAVDISGQHVHPFSPGLLPGAQEPEPVVSERMWNTQLLQQQRKQLAAIRGAGRGHGRGAGFVGGGAASGAGPGRGGGAAHPLAYAGWPGGPGAAVAAMPSFAGHGSAAGRAAPVRGGAGYFRGAGEGRGFAGRGAGRVHAAAAAYSNTGPGGFAAGFGSRGRGAPPFPPGTGARGMGAYRGGRGPLVPAGRQPAYGGSDGWQAPRSRGWWPPVGPGGWRPPAGPGGWAPPGGAGPWEGGWGPAQAAAPAPPFRPRYGPPAAAPPREDGWVPVPARHRAGSGGQLGPRPSLAAAHAASSSGGGVSFGGRAMGQGSTGWAPQPAQPAHRSEWEPAPAAGGVVPHWQDPTAWVLEQEEQGGHEKEREGEEALLELPPDLPLELLEGTVEGQRLLAQQAQRAAAAARHQQQHQQPHCPQPPPPGLPAAPRSPPPGFGAAPSPVADPTEFVRQLLPTLPQPAQSPQVGPSSLQLPPLGSLTASQPKHPGPAPGSPAARLAGQRAQGRYQYMPMAAAAASGPPAAQPPPSPSHTDAAPASPAVAASQSAASPLAEALPWLLAGSSPEGLTPAGSSGSGEQAARREQPASPGQRPAAAVPAAEPAAAEVPRAVSTAAAAAAAEAPVEVSAPAAAAEAPGTSDSLEDLLAWLSPAGSQPPPGSESSSEPAAATPAAAASADLEGDGEALPWLGCAACHQPAAPPQAGRMPPLSEGGPGTAMASAAAEEQPAAAEPSVAEQTLLQEPSRSVSPPPAEPPLVEPAEGLAAGPGPGLPAEAASAHAMSAAAEQPLLQEPDRSLSPPPAEPPLVGEAEVSTAKPSPDSPTGAVAAGGEPAAVQQQPALQDPSGSVSAPPAMPPLVEPAEAPTAGPAPGTPKAAAPGEGKPAAVEQPALQEPSGSESPPPAMPALEEPDEASAAGPGTGTPAEAAPADARSAAAGQPVLQEPSHSVSPPPAEPEAAEPLAAEPAGSMPLPASAGAGSEPAAAGAADQPCGEVPVPTAAPSVEAAAQQGLEALDDALPWLTSVAAVQAVPAATPPTRSPRAREPAHAAAAAEQPAGSAQPAPGERSGSGSLGAEGAGAAAALVETLPASSDATTAAGAGATATSAAAQPEREASPASPEADDMLGLPWLASAPATLPAAVPAALAAAPPASPPAQPASATPVDEAASEGGAGGRAGTAAAGGEGEGSIAGAAVAAEKEPLAEAPLLPPSSGEAADAYSAAQPAAAQPERAASPEAEDLLAMPWLTTTSAFLPAVQPGGEPLQNAAALATMALAEPTPMPTPPANVPGAAKAGPGSEVPSTSEPVAPPSMAACAAGGGPAAAAQQAEQQEDHDDEMPWLLSIMCPATPGPLE